MTLIRTVHKETLNGTPYVGKIYERPGLSVSAVAGDPESFCIRTDDMMTFYPREVREIAAALVALASYMEQKSNAGEG